LKTVVRKLYEAMFLIDSAKAATDWDASLAAIKSILERAEAEIVSIRKWDERKLAYEIRGKSRGTYILCYFRADGERIRDIERDVRLSEQIMRVLILGAEHMMQEDIEKDTPAMQAEKHGQEAAEGASGKIGREQFSDDQENQASALVAEQPEKAEQSAEPVATDTGGTEHSEQDEAKDIEEQ
jgi:small subunit ribosomal protein S6